MTPTKPYQLTSSCELSEDYFMVANHLIDPDQDTVVAYSRTDGQVEAIVLQDGVVKQVYRDPSQPTGWNVNPLPGAEDVTQMVAGVSAPTAPLGNAARATALKVCFVKKGSDQLWVASQNLVSGKVSTDFSVAHVNWTSDAPDLKIALGVDNSLLVTAVTRSANADSGDARLWFWTDSGSTMSPDYTVSGSLTGFSYDPTSNGGWAAAVGTATHFGLTARTIFLYLPGGTDDEGNDDLTLHVWTAPLSSTSGRLTNQDSYFDGGLQPPEGSMVIADVVCLASLGAWQVPTALIWTEGSIEGGRAGNPRLWTVTWDEEQPGTSWVWTELGLPDTIKARSNTIPVSTALTPRAQTSKNGAAQLLDVFVVFDETLHVLRQIQQADDVVDALHPMYTPLLPLQPGVSTMTSQAGVSTGDELLVVGTDHVLQTLERDPVSGSWADAELQLPAISMQQDSAYRVTLSLTDVAWNLPVTGQMLKITASTSALATIDAPTGITTVLVGADPVLVPTDADGEVMIALLADGLSAPTLTITADGLGAPVTVQPSAAVNSYLSGNQKMNYLDPLSATTLQTAVTPTGEVVAPGASDPKAAADAVDTMTQVATLGGQGAALGRTSSTVGRVDGGRTHGTRHPKPRKAVSAKAMGSKIDNWAHDVFHAVKKGAVAVEKVTVDAEHKIVTFAVDATDWVDNVVQVVINGIEDAAHVLHAAFNKLAADIVHVVKWLEAEVIGVLKSAKLLSDDFETWIGDFCGFAGTMLSTEEAKVVGWLEKEQSSVTTRLTKLAGRFSGKTTLSTMATNPPNALGGGKGGHPRPGSKTNGKLTDDDDSGQPVHGDWFYRKIKHELRGSGLKIDLSSLPDLKDKVVAFGEKSLLHSPGFQNQFRDEFWKGFINDVVRHPDDVRDIFVQPLLQALLKVVNDAFDFAENIVTEAFDLLRDIATSIPRLLSGTTLKDLPILGALMKLIGLGDVSIGRVANLIFAFPTAVVFKIARGADAQPFASTSVSRTSGASGSEATDLQICAASVMGTWALFDTASAAFIAGDEDGGILFTAVDIAAPLISTILTTPAAKDGLPFFAPPVSGNDSDVMGFIAWFFGSIPALTAALPEVFERTIADDAKKRDSYVQVTLWVETLTGVLALVFGMIGNSEKSNPKGSDYAGAVLNNMPTIAAAGLADILKEATAGVSVVVAMALILICGELGAAIYGADG